MTSQLIVAVAVTVLTATASPAATVIDFEAQGASAPSTFSATLNSPLTIGIATFTGGKLLKNEVSSPGPSADTTAVYATVGGVFAGYTDPLVVTFSQPVSDVSLRLTNETPDTYTLADNLGHSVALAIGNNVNQTLSLTDTGATQITLATAGTVDWDFAIDNVTFTAVAPEPATVLSVGLALIGALLIRRRFARR